jgi:hypothetical protein
MVNFTAKLQDNTRQEWLEHYVDYKALKRLLKPLKKGAPAKRASMMTSYSGDASDSDEEATAPGDLVGGLKDRLHLLSMAGKSLGKPSKTGRKGDAGESASLLASEEKQLRSRFYGGGGAAITKMAEEGLATHAEEEEGRENEEEHEHGCLTPDEVGQREVDSQRFEAVLLTELEKVQQFYAETITDLGQQLGFLKAQLRGDGNKGSQLALEDLTSWAHPMSEEDKRRAKHLAPKERELIETTLMRLNRELTLLENFCIINYTGFIKILKKHDKLMPSRPLRASVLPQLEKAQFFRHARLEDIKLEVTTIFADVFCNKDKNQAAAMLLPKRFRTNVDFFLLQLGYKLGKTPSLLLPTPPGLSFPPILLYFSSPPGVAATLALWVVWDCVVQVAKFGKPTIVTKMAFPVFRAVGGLLLLHWCWGIIEHFCNYLRINFVYLLDLSPKNVSSPRKIFDEAVNESIVYLTCMLLYYKVLVGGFPDWIPAGFYPIFLLVYTLYCLVFPWKQRKGIWWIVGRVVVAPLVSVTLLDTVVADVLTSLVKVLLDLAWSAFYVISGDFTRDIRGAPDEVPSWELSVLYSKVLAPVIVILPYWWRFMQCLRRFYDTGNRWPHLLNATKYAMAQTVTLFGAFHHVYYHVRGGKGGRVHPSLTYDVVWVMVTVISTFYSYVWDVTMDWGLGRPSKGFLNDRRMCSSNVPYYSAMVADLFLRFLWVNTLIPPGSGGLFSLPLYLNAFLMVMEILRRMFWGVFRLENEQLRNTQGFRRVDVIPLSFSTENQHEYRDPKNTNNLRVILEVSFVAGLVIFLSIGAVVVADGIDEGV